MLSNYYKSILKENDRSNCKPYIKSRLQENIPDMSLIQPPARKAPERLCTKQL